MERVMVDLGAEMAKRRSSAHSSIFNEWAVRASAIWSMLELEQERIIVPHNNAGFIHTFRNEIPWLFHDFPYLKFQKFQVQKCNIYITIWENYTVFFKTIHPLLTRFKSRVPMAITQKDLGAHQFILHILITLVECFHLSYV